MRLFYALRGQFVAHTVHSLAKFLHIIISLQELSDLGISGKILDFKFLYKDNIILNKCKLSNQIYCKHQPICTVDSA
jgi:hypothetical protein